MRSVERGICPIAPVALRLTLYLLTGCRDIEPQTFWGHDHDPFGSRDVIGHVTIGTTVGRFLLVIR